MSTPTIALLSPGEMGAAVGRVLREHSARVITCLEGRSDRTRQRASAAGLEAVPDLATLVREADLLLSILVPAEAPALAQRVATALREGGGPLVYVDCNAVAPQTVRAMAEGLTAVSAGFVDAGIIGGPPAPGRARPRFYASGPAAAVLARLVDFGLDVRVLGPAVGQASGLKMCYAALTKGLTALAVELLVAADRLQLTDALRAEMTASQSDLLRWVERQVPGMPPKAARWIGEMEEIAATFAALGLTPKLLEGAADLYRFVEQSAPSAAAEAPHSLEAIVAQLASELRRQQPDPPADGASLFAAG